MACCQNEQSTPSRAAAAEARLSRYPPYPPRSWFPKATSSTVPGSWFPAACCLVGSCIRCTPCRTQCPDDARYADRPAAASPARSSPAARMARYSRSACSAWKAGKQVPHVATQSAGGICVGGCNCTVALTSRCRSVAEQWRLEICPLFRCRISILLRAIPG